jgi:hypothetical protein
MAINDSGFESEDQIFYSDTESESDFEILPINNVGHNNNNLQQAFLQHIPIENNVLQVQDHSDILQISEDLDQLMEAMEDQARMDPMREHEEMMQHLVLPGPRCRQECGVQGSICEEPGQIVQMLNLNYSKISDEFESLCDNLESVCEIQQPRTSTPIPYKRNMECQTEPQDGDDERLYDGELNLMSFSNEQVHRIITKHDLECERYMERELNITQLYTEANNKCHQYYSEILTLREQLVVLDNKARRDLQDAQKTIDDISKITENQDTEIRTMKQKMEQMKDENARIRNIHERERKNEQRRTNEFYNSRHRMRTPAPMVSSPIPMQRFRQATFAWQTDGANTSGRNNFFYNGENSEATTSNFFRFGNQHPKGQ